ncbi:Outer membrane protein and related peptidoglycan-associated (lipo)protein [Smithella sp. ME-1]|nr:Outer membrane protein and related peptidoglycan-associated (lipo)protein [Smithella sp. ME-1]
MKMKKEDNAFYLNLISSGDSSFGVRKECKVDIKNFPILCWRWKVNKLPKGGDIRKLSTDDQALQLYVAFKAIGFPALINTPVIGYIWDCEAPKGWSGRSQQIGADKLRYIVLRNRTDKTGQWYTERRNLYQDYKRLFGDIKGGEPQGLTTGLQIHINTHKTKTTADSEIGEIYFSAAPSDIALAESAREIKQLQDINISAVKAPPPPKIIAVKKQIPADCLNIIIEFNSSSADVGDSYNDKMQAVIEYIIKNPKAILTITGHTDNTGSNQYNLILSEKRAESVKNYLVNNFNIDEQRLTTQGIGSAEPVADNDAEEGRKNNRRVTINDCP